MARHRPHLHCIPLLGAALMVAAAFAQAQPARVHRLQDRWEVFGGGMMLGLDHETGQITSVGIAGEQVSAGRGGVHFLDGRTARLLGPVRVEGDEMQSAGLSLTWTEPENGLTGAHLIRADDRAIHWQVTVTNRGAEQRRLEVRLGLPLTLEGGWRYWDGRNPAVEVGPESRVLSARAAPVLDDEPCTKLQSHYGLNFPLSCGWDDAAGVAVGLEPNEPRSYFAGGAEPGLSSADALYYATQMVIDAGESDTAHFVMFGFDPAWQERGALERMYATFPDAYRADPEIDPRVTRHCAVTGTQTLMLGREMLWEECRRLRLGWTWGTNARYAGLCYPDEGREQNERQIQQAYWAFLNPRYVRECWVKDALAGGGGLTVAEHRRYVREAFDDAEEAVAVALDITCQYLDKEVALAEFTDSQLMRPNGTFVDIPNIQVMYAWGNSFGQTHARLVREGVRALQPAGVHLDNAVGYDHHYGPGAEATPGRAFSPEHDRIYSLEGVAQAMHMRAAREQRVRGRRVYVAGNTVGTWFGAALADASLIESLGPWQGEGERWRGKQAQPGFEHYLALRYLLGGKTLTFCGPYPWEVKLTDEEQALPPEERQPIFVRRYEELTRDLPLFAYRVGATSISYVLQSCGNIREHAKTLERLARAGWRPVPAARADDPALWVERFGELPGGMITVGNPTDAEVRAHLHLDPERCGTVAMAEVDGAPVEVAVQEGATVAPVVLAPRRPLAWQVVAAMNPPLPDGSALAATVSRGATRIQVHCPTACQTTARVALPEGHGFSAMAVDLGLQDATVSNGVASARIALEAGDSVIEVRHPAWYEVGPEVGDFPFFEERQCRSAIVLQAEASPKERSAAEHLSRYFQYWFAHTDGAPGRYDLLWQVAEDAHQIPVVEPDAIPEDAALILIGAPELPRVAGLEPAGLGEGLRGEARVTHGAQGRPTLILRARAANDLDPTLRALLATLDEHHPF